MQVLSDHKGEQSLVIQEQVKCLPNQNS